LGEGHSFVERLKDEATLERTRKVSGKKRVLFAVGNYTTSTRSPFVGGSVVRVQMGHTPSSWPERNEEITWFGPSRVSIKPIKGRRKSSGSGCDLCREGNTKCSRQDQKGLTLKPDRFSEKRSHDREC